jgi:hypothetical protein
MNGPPTRTPLEFVKSLGLADVLDVGAMSDRQVSFKAVAMGERDLNIGTLLDVITSDLGLRPPRTGHIGNWGNIAQGRAGAMDFNLAICGPGYGYPLLFGFNQTEAETATGRTGDWGYLPGSLVDRDERILLPLHAWNGREFAACGRSKPLFTPFIQAEFDGGLQPLTTIHVERLAAIPEFEFAYEQAIIADHATMLRPLLTVLIEEARSRPNVRRALADLISHAVALDGTVTRADLVPDGKGYQLGESYFPSTEALVDMAFEPFSAVAKPRTFMDRIGSLPWQLPLASNLLITVLSAILETHYPNTATAPTRGLGPLTLHPHWGGRDMAGYPPRRKGYMSDDGKLRSLKGICRTLVANFVEIKPLGVALLPASIFLLCPANTTPVDADLISNLFRRLKRGVVGDYQQARIEAISRDWFETNCSRLSPYFTARFGPRRGGIGNSNVPSSSLPIEPDGFRDLTLRQASMITGALFECGSSMGPTP